MSTKQKAALEKFMKSAAAQLCAEIDADREFSKAFLALIPKDDAPQAHEPVPFELDEAKAALKPRGGVPKLGQTVCVHGNPEPLTCRECRRGEP